MPSRSHSETEDFTLHTLASVLAQHVSIVRLNIFNVLSEGMENHMILIQNLTFLPPASSSVLLNSCSVTK